MTAALPWVVGIPVDLLLFDAVLAGVALFHHHGQAFKNVGGLN